MTCPLTIRSAGFFALFLGFLPFHIAATTYYVDINSPNPTPPYNSWATASTDIQSAVNLTANGDLVLVNPGVYQSGGYTAPDGMLTAVVVSNSVNLQSVDGPSATFINGSNAMRCIYLGNGSILTGFTLTNGMVETYGLYCASTNAVVTNCVITHCQAGGVYGGTLYNCLLTANKGGATESAMFNCVISNNSATEEGGGIYGGILNNCLIVTNSASFGGGGVYAASGFPAILNNCIISNNAAMVGGGVYNSLNYSNDTTPFTNCILNNCILAGNRGGGAFNAQLNNCLISSNKDTVYSGGGVLLGSLNNCTLIGNIADVGGGAAGDGVETILSNCLLIANVAVEGGGAYWCILDNCFVISNSAYYGGGADECDLTNCVLAYNNGEGANSSTLVNCTVTANTADGIYDSTAENSILYYNTGGDYYPSNSSSYPLNYCCTAVLPTYGFRNITNTPLFVNVTNDFHLQSNSPCINAGNNAYVTSATDPDGNPRIVGGTVDIGAYEYQTPTSIISYAYLQQYGLPTDGSVDYADLDGTAFNVYQDWVTGLNPTNPASVLAMLTPIVTNSMSGALVSWQSVSGITYFLQRSTNLVEQPAFTTLQSGITGQANTTSYMDATATNNIPYSYRVGVTAP